MDISQLLSQALQHHQKGELAEANQYYQAILKREPNHAEALHLLGVLLYQCQDYALSIQLIQRAIKNNPTQPAFYNNLGNSFSANQQPEEAQEAYKTAIKLSPTYAGAYENLGNLLVNQGQLQEALNYFHKALELDPNHAGIYVNLGNLLQRLKKFEAAITIYSQGVSKHLLHPALYYGLAEIYRVQNAFSEAIKYYQKALELKPDYHEAQFNLAHVYAQSHQFEEAIEGYKRLLGDYIHQSDLLYHLGNVYADACQLETALDYYQQSLQLEPHHQEAWVNYLYYLRAIPGNSNQQLFQACLDWQNTLPVLPTIPLKPVREKKKLRIGYVSPDFRTHSASTLFVYLFQHHNPKTFEIFAYGEVERPDQMTEMFQHLSHGWRSTTDLSDEELAQQIRNDNIDILVDLAGNTTHSRFLVFRHRPAPIQVTGLGFGCTSGLAEIDYRFSDPHMTSPEICGLNTEKVFYLTSLMRWIPFDFDLPLEPLPYLKRGYITFGCGNNPFKINHQVVKVWATILHQCPSSKLHLKSSLLGYSFIQNYFVQLFQAQGISSERLIFSGATPQTEHLKFYQSIDIALDPFSCNGGITSCEALWMGIPIVSLNGGNQAGSSILSQIGLTQWSHSSEDSYITCATELAQNRDQLSQWHQSLRTRLLDSEICQGQRFCQEVERAYQMMWLNYCQKINRY